MKRPRRLVLRRWGDITWPIAQELPPGNIALRLDPEGRRELQKAVEGSGPLVLYIVFRRASLQLMVSEGREELHMTLSGLSVLRPRQRGFKGRSVVEIFLPVEAVEGFRDFSDGVIIYRRWRDKLDSLQGAPGA